MITNLTMEEAKRVIEELAYEYGELHDSYSGRCMCGEKCLAVITKEPIRLIERAAIAGVIGAELDVCGLQSVVYWPALTLLYNSEEPEDKTLLCPAWAIEIIQMSNQDTYDDVLGWDESEEVVVYGDMCCVNEDGDEVFSQGVHVLTKSGDSVIVDKVPGPAPLKKLKKTHPEKVVAWALSRME